MSTPLTDQTPSVERITRTLNFTFIWTLTEFILLMALLVMFCFKDFLNTGIVERMHLWWVDPVFDSEIWIGLLLFYNQIAMVKVTELVANFADRSKFHQSKIRYFSTYSLTVIVLSTINVVILGHLILT